MLQSGVAGLSMHSVPSRHGTFGAIPPAQLGAQTPGQVNPSSSIHAMLLSIVQTNPFEHPSPLSISHCDGGKQTPVQSAAITHPGVAGLSTQYEPDGQSKLFARPPAQVGTHLPGHSAPTIAIHAIFGSKVHENPSLHPSPVLTLHDGGGKQTPVQSAAMEQVGVSGLSTHEVPSGHGA